MSSLCSFVPNGFLDGSRSLRKLGEGTFGAVYLIQLPSGQQYAVKYMAALDGVDAGALLDMDALVRLRHDPGVIHLVGICYERARIAIIMEAMDMNLSSFIRITPSPVRLEIFPRLFQSLARAAALFETISISHFDIKPQNILVQGTNRAAQFKVTDFGLSRSLHIDPPLYEVFTVWYRPPEFLVERDRKSFNILAGDIWAIGVTLVEFITGVPLFPGPNSRTVLQRIYAQVAPGVTYSVFLQQMVQGTIAGQVPLNLVGVEPGLQELLSRMLSLNPKDRPSGVELLAYFQIRLAPQHILTLLDKEAPRRVQPDLIQLLLRTAVRFALSRATQVIGLELLTRYLGTVSGPSSPPIALAAIRMAASYNEDLSISSSRLGGASVIEAERQLLQAVDYQIYNSNLVAVIERVYRDNLHPIDCLPGEFAARLDRWFMTQRNQEQSAPVER